MKPQNALEIIAAKEGISVEEVRREIQLAIDETMKIPTRKFRRNGGKSRKRAKSQHLRRL